MHMWVHFETRNLEIEEPIWVKAVSISRGRIGRSRNVRSTSSKMTLLEGGHGERRPPW
jgi:hypothetical protein